MIGVFIADDHEVVRDGIKRFLSNQADITVLGEAATVAGLLEHAPEGDGEVLVLDLNFPDGGGIELIRQLKAARPFLPVVVFSMQDEVTHALSALRAGASAFLNKGCSPDELLRALHKVAGGGRYITHEIAEHMLLHSIALDKAPHETLSEREQEVFANLARGQTPAQIAETMGRSQATISTYVYRIKKKLAVHSIGEIVSYAHRNGLVS